MLWGSSLNTTSLISRITTPNTYRLDISSATAKLTLGSSSVTISMEPTTPTCNDCRKLPHGCIEGRKFPYTCNVWPFFTEDNVLCVPDARLRCFHICSYLACEIKQIVTERTRIYPPLPPFPSAPGYVLTAEMARVEFPFTEDRSKPQWELRFSIPSQDLVVVKLCVIDSAGTSSNWYVISLLTLFKTTRVTWFSRNLSYPSTNSDASWSTCKQWIDLCDDSHPQCSQLRLGTDLTNKWVPSRLLHILSGSEESKEVVQLCNGINGGCDVQYVALSHCWGQNFPELSKLTTTSISRLKEGVQVNTLSTTFKDAILATKNIGLSYIWIDSLCIMQDSTEDWLKEAGLMCNVYQRSYVNIAATSSADSSGSLFTNRHPLSTVPCTVRMNLDGHAPRDFHVFPESQAKWGSAVDYDSVLNSRAWVFQERLLSTRTIHFAANQMYWECCKLRASENFQRDCSFSAAVVRIPMD